MAASASTPLKRTSEEQDESTLQPSDHSEHISQDANSSAQNGHSSQQHDGGSMQKRRRVTRACDECRKKKIRCDGKQPCTHCTVYSYECSYDQPSNRRRNPAPLFLEAMEKKLHRAEAILQICFPGASLDDARFDMLLRDSISVDTGNIASVSAKFNSLDPSAATTHIASESESDLESMITSKGALDQNAQGEYNYFGASSGFNFMRRMSEEFGELANGRRGNQHPKPSVSDLSTLKSRRMSSAMMTIPGPARQDSPPEHDVSIDDLPPKEMASRLVRFALDDACAILPVVHQPSFFAAFDRIYDLPPEEYKTGDHRFLPLLYMVIALGCLFAKDGDSELERKGYLSATDQGYFSSARQLMDITDCRDLVSLQAVIFMILFLQCSAKLATCYAFIGVALRSAMRMGLHRSFAESFNPVESELRKRCFWIIRKMDVFVGAMLGLPLTLSDDDIDQEYPTEADDENVTPEGIKPQAPDQLSLIAATNQDFRLTAIVQKIVRNIYAIKGLRESRKVAPKEYRVPLSRIKGIERDLQAWEDQLHHEFKPGHDAPPKLLRVRNLLRMAFAHVQLLLYRPFLHYVSARLHKGTIESSSQACAAACVHVSRNIIHITASMNQNGSLVGSYWFTMYTSFFAVLSLVFYALENEGVSQEIMQDALLGRQTLAAVAQRSMAADRCTAALTVLFEQILMKLDHSGSPLHPVALRANYPQTQPIPHSTAPAGMSDFVSGTDKSAAYPQVGEYDTSRHVKIEPRGTSEALRPASTHPPLTPSTQVSHRFPTPANLQTHLNQHQPATQNLPFAASNLQGQNQHQQFEGPQFSSLIFPSSDPFAYPNQPMLALGQSRGFPESRQRASQAPNSFMPPSTASVPMTPSNDLVDAQTMGMSAYAGPEMQQQTPHQQGHPTQARLMQDGRVQFDSDQAMVGSAGVQFPGLDFGDFFGNGGWSQQMG